MLAIPKWVTSGSTVAAALMALAEQHAVVQEVSVSAFMDRSVLLQESGGETGQLCQSPRRRAKAQTPTALRQVPFPLCFHLQGLFHTLE
ncbi:MAG: hypothetical protein AUI84_10225 [Delftia sp. 13_1_40CM_3_66_6]|uniref:Uncharacterized protein n=2 Tax=Comamonadaceae TaxID=80864 RepID=A0A2W5SRY8_VARPD|nr:hypothetical protein BI380_17560 [Delftia tsuruhatensis]OJX11985.1 MAG: hypothetical protein BGO79_22475 [Delftia sp. 67-8]OLE08214.1 MAG: hypothetical protein AUG53_05965 [Delftia sp. 13_1_20CM_4_67_18]OLE94267.1 MAG: hypothetical protein AUI84_10225 [Delftia sp. 13_1_40CM_3_66_6]OVZ61319.1 hypothetical protein CDO44_06700 [Pigmentiphaga sp. NML080357]PZQ77530.1 MAG: hypothetical protein DI563_03370 [Variovorax paradoxus]HBY34472.1 hypothetical protein [Delftia acidovorans]